MKSARGWILRRNLAARTAQRAIPTPQAAGRSGKGLGGGWRGSRARVFDGDAENHPRDAGATPGLVFRREMFKMSG